MQYEPAARVAAGYGVSLRTARKWKSRHDHGGQEALADRSSRPRRCRNKLSEEDFCCIFELRKARKTGDEIALYLGLCRSSVFRALRKLSCSRLASLEKREPVQRYQWENPGKMLHLDIKKLGKIDGVGHRKAGTRQVHRLILADVHSNRSCIVMRKSETSCFGLKNSKMKMASYQPEKTQCTPWIRKQPLCH